MPKTKISEYSATANSNTDVASINIDEGCAPSGINNAIRAVMGHLKDFQQGTNGDPFNGPVNGTVGATTPSTGAFTTLSASSTVTLSGGTANGVAYLNGSKVLTTGSALTFDGTNLGLGVTPSAWSAHKILQVGAWTSFGSFNGNLNAQMMNNSYWDGSAYRYIGSSQASYFSTSQGAFQWNTAPSGTAGNAITFTTAMTLDASGGLKVLNTIGVGNTAPSTSGAGITFPATQSASSDANTLDDYEEGTFTPTIVYSGTNTPTYNTQLGRYTKIGRVVSVQITFSWNENGSTGNVTVGALPFTAVTSNARAIPSVLSFGLTGLPTSMSVTGFVNTNATTMSLFLNDNAATTLTATYTDNDQDLYITVTYETA